MHRMRPNQAVQFSLSHKIYEQGEVADKNVEKAYFYYADALYAFLKQDGKDDNMLDASESGCTIFPFS